MSTWDWIKDHIDPGNLLHDNPVPNQPGVTANGASAPNVSQFQRDPITGMYYDPTTGGVYADQYGTQQVTNPNVAQQVAKNFQTSGALLGGLTGARADAAAANSGQVNLLGQLASVVNGTAPSVAGTQLASTFGDISRSVNSAASGYSGNNAFAARQQAMRTIADQQQRQSQAIAQLRAQEVAAARNAQGGILANMAGNANTQAGQDIGAGLGFGELAQKGQAAQQGLDYDASKANTEERNDKAQRTAGAIGSLWGFGGGGKK